jgi:hypothetical protein
MAKVPITKVRLTREKHFFVEYVLCEVGTFGNEDPKK